MQHLLDSLKVEEIVHWSVPMKQIFLPIQVNEEETATHETF